MHSWGDSQSAGFPGSLFTRSHPQRGPVGGGYRTDSMCISWMAMHMNKGSWHCDAGNVLINIYDHQWWHPYFPSKITCVLPLLYNGRGNTDHGYEWFGDANTPYVCILSMYILNCCEKHVNKRFLYQSVSQSNIACPLMGISIDIWKVNGTTLHS